MPDVMSNLLERYIGEVKNLFGGSLRQVILYQSRYMQISYIRKQLQK